jgi:hypothetical protein
LQFRCLGSMTFLNFSVSTHNSVIGVNGLSQECLYKHCQGYLSPTQCAHFFITFPKRDSMSIVRRYLSPAECTKFLLGVNDFSKFSGTQQRVPVCASSGGTSSPHSAPTFCYNIYNNFQKLVQAFKNKQYFLQLTASSFRWLRYRFLKFPNYFIKIPFKFMKTSTNFFYIIWLALENCYL